MCCLKTFCWSYSLATGTIMAAILTAFQGGFCVVLAMYISCLDKRQEDWKKNHLPLQNATLTPQTETDKLFSVLSHYFLYVWGSLVTFPIMVTNIVCLISLCVGIISNNNIGIILWLLIESLLIVLFITTAVVATMLQIYSISGLGFFILLMIYMWFVVLSYFNQMTSESYTNVIK